jgi:hypothetical protein
MYLVLLMLLGFYWKNNGYSLTQQDAWFISGIVAIVFFNITCDLKAYWMYKYVLKNIDFEFFNGKHCSRIETMLCHPLMGGIIAFFVTRLITQAIFLLSEKTGVIFGLLLIVPLSLYFIYRQLRICCIKQVIMGNFNARPKKLHQSLINYISLSLVLNILTISPLKKNVDFSLKEGLLSPGLIFAMVILCAIVLAINLIFSYRSRCYIFLGEIFLKKVEIASPPAIPCASLQAKPIALRMLLWLIVQFAWILLLNAVLTLLEWKLPFEVYYVFCFIPAGAYYCLHMYWLWHSDYLAACDMYFRYDEIRKRSDLW